MAALSHCALLHAHCLSALQGAIYGAPAPAPSKKSSSSSKKSKSKADVSSAFAGAGLLLYCSTAAAAPEWTSAWHADELLPCAVETCCRCLRAALNMEGEGDEEAAAEEAEAAPAPKIAKKSSKKKAAAIDTDSLFAALGGDEGEGGGLVHGLMFKLERPGLGVPVDEAW